MKICISITESDIGKVKKLLNEFDFCELRLDLIKPDIADLKDLISINKNVIVTCRQTKGIDRIEYLKEAIKHSPEYIDIEFETEESTKEGLIKLCESYGVKRIHSYHNFNETPEYDFLKKIMKEEYRQFNPTIIKVATFVNSEKDNITLLSLLKEGMPLVVLGMGEKGRKSRILAPLFGSKFTFASVNNNPSAPGQIDYFEMKRFYDFWEAFNK